MKNDHRNEKIVELRSKGIPYSKISKLFSISRARAHQICSGYNQNGMHRYDIFDRDKHKCQWGECCNGSTKLVVHHIDFNDRNNDPKNLITLCAACHASFHRRFHIDSDKEDKILNRNVRKCKYCDTEFREYNKRVFCSRECKMKYRLREISELRHKGLKWKEISKLLHSHPRNLCRLFNLSKQNK